MVEGEGEYLSLLSHVHQGSVRVLNLGFGFKTKPSPSLFPSLKKHPDPSTTQTRTNTFLVNFLEWGNLHKLIKQHIQTRVKNSLNGALTKKIYSAKKIHNKLKNIQPV